MWAVGIDPAHLTEMYAHTVKTATGHRQASLLRSSVALARGVSAETPDVVGEEASARGGDAVLTPARPDCVRRAHEMAKADLRGDHLSRRPRCEQAGHFQVG
jgi:hypothetical protein